jgi:hypothetical protein
MIVEYFALATALITFITAIIGYFALRGKMTEIHVLVNSRLSWVVARVTQLTDVLNDHGIAIPDDPNDPPLP